MRFKTIEEAKRFGVNVDLLDLPEKTKKTKDKREEIKKLISDIRSASYDFDFGDDDSYVLTVNGFTAPSWNKMIRMNYRMYSSYSKALKNMIIDAGFVAKALKKHKVFSSDKPISVNVHCERRYLLDLDNVCAKHIIDGIVACGIVKDDKMKFIQAYNATQTKSKVDRVIVTLKEI